MTDLSKKLDQLKLSRFFSGTSPEFLSAFGTRLQSRLQDPDFRKQIEDVGGPALFAQIQGLIDVPLNPEEIRKGQERRTAPLLGSDALFSASKGAANLVEGFGLDEALLNSVAGEDLGESDIVPFGPGEGGAGTVDLPLLGEQDPIALGTQLAGFVVPANAVVGAAGGLIGATGLAASHPALASMAAFALGGGTMEAARQTGRHFSKGEDFDPEQIAIEAAIFGAGGTPVGGGIIGSRLRAAGLSGLAAGTVPLLFGESPDPQRVASEVAFATLFGNPSIADAPISVKSAVKELGDVPAVDVPELGTTAPKKGSFLEKQLEPAPQSPAQLTQVLRVRQRAVEELSKLSDSQLAELAGRKLSPKEAVLVRDAIAAKAGRVLSDVDAPVEGVKLPEKEVKVTQPPNAEQVISDLAAFDPGPKIFRAPIGDPQRMADMVTNLALKQVDVAGGRLTPKQVKVIMQENMSVNQRLQLMIAIEDVVEKMKTELLAQGKKVPAEVSLQKAAVKAIDLKVGKDGTVTFNPTRQLADDRVILRQTIMDDFTVEMNRIRKQLDVEEGARAVDPKTGEPAPKSQLHQDLEKSLQRVRDQQAAVEQSTEVPVPKNETQARKAAAEITKDFTDQELANWVPGSEFGKFAETLQAWAKQQAAEREAIRAESKRELDALERQNNSSSSVMFQLKKFGGAGEEPGITAAGRQTTEGLSFVELKKKALDRGVQVHLKEGDTPFHATHNGQSFGIKTLKELNQVLDDIDALVAPKRKKVAPKGREVAQSSKAAREVTPLPIRTADDAEVLDIRTGPAIEEPPLPIRGPAIDDPVAIRTGDALEGEPIPIRGPSVDEPVPIRTGEPIEEVVVPKKVTKQVVDAAAHRKGTVVTHVGEGRYKVTNKLTGEVHRVDTLQEAAKIVGETDAPLAVEIGPVPPGTVTTGGGGGIGGPGSSGRVPFDIPEGVETSFPGTMRLVFGTRGETFKRMQDATGIPVWDKIWEPLMRMSDVRDKFQKDFLQGTKHAKGLAQIIKNVDAGRMRVVNDLLIAGDKLAQVVRDNRATKVEVQAAKDLRSWYQRLLKLDRRQIDRFFQEGVAAFREVDGDVNRAVVDNTLEGTLLELVDDIYSGRVDLAEPNAAAMAQDILFAVGRQRLMKPVIQQAEDMKRFLRQRIISKDVPPEVRKDMTTMLDFSERFMDSTINGLRGGTHGKGTAKILNSLQDAMKRAGLSKGDAWTAQDIERISGEISSYISGSALSARVAPAFRNMWQRLLVGPKVGYDTVAIAQKEALTPEGIRLVEASGAIPGRITFLIEDVAAIMGGRKDPGALQAARRFIQQAQNNGLFPYRKADHGNRAVTFLAGRKSFKDNAHLLREGKVDDFLVNTGLAMEGSTMINRLLKPLQEVDAAGWEAAVERSAREYGKRLTEDTQFIYNPANAPFWMQSIPGRFMGQFGIWATAFTEYMLRNGLNKELVSGAFETMKIGGNLTPQQRVAIRFVSRYAGMIAVLEGLEATLGVDLSSYNRANPLDFEGGPAFQAFRDIITLSTGTGGDFGDKLAQRNLERFFATFSLPFGGLAQDLSQAEEEGDPGKAIMLGLGFTLREEQ